MNQNQNPQEFRYTYSAKEQEELKRIREKYSDREENKLERLRRLDNGVTQKAQAISLIFGVIGTLVLGGGMSLAMSDLGQALGLQNPFALILGIVLGVIGGVIAGLAYPVYNYVIKRERKKIAPEVLRLTDELLK